MEDATLDALGVSLMMHANFLDARNKCINTVGEVVSEMLSWKNDIGTARLNPALKKLDGLREDLILLHNTIPNMGEVIKCCEMVAKAANEYEK